MGFVYKITNNITGKFYIGSTVNIKTRMQCHFRTLKSGVHHNKYLQNSYNKHGDKAFDSEIIYAGDHYIELEQLVLQEIDKTKAYNISKQACGGDIVSYHPDRDKIVEKMSQSLILMYKNMSNEDRLNMGLRVSMEKNPNWKGGKTYCKCGNRKNMYAKSCSKCRDRTGDKNPFYGKKHSKEAKLKIKEKRMQAGSKHLCKKIYFYGIVFESSKELSLFIGKTQGMITYMVKSDNKKYSKVFYVDEDF